MTTNDQIEIKDEDIQHNDFTAEELESTDFDWKAKAQELQGIAKRRATQLGKAKAKLREYEEKLKTHLNPEPQDKKPDEQLLNRIDSLSLHVAGVKKDTEIELFNKWKKDTGRNVELIVSNPIFQAELQKIRDDESNQLATANIKGGGGENLAKNDPAYWIAKGTPPSETDIPDRAMRTKVVRAFIANSKSGKKFHNE